MKQLSESHQWRPELMATTTSIPSNSRPRPGDRASQAVAAARAVAVSGHGLVRFLDVSSGGSLIEVRAGDGQFDITYVGENGWETVPSPTSEQLLRVRFFREIALEPWGALFRSALETVHENVCRILRKAAAGAVSAPDRTRTGRERRCGSDGRSRSPQVVAGDCLSGGGTGTIARRRESFRCS